MKSLTIHTLVVAMAVAVALWGTASMAAAVELSTSPMSQSEKDTISATAAASPAPLYALSRLDTQSLAEQEMTDQELKAVEGGETVVYIHGGNWLTLDSGWLHFFGGIGNQCGCTVTVGP